MPDVLPIERDERGVVTLTLRQEGRPVVVLDSALLDSINATLDEIERGPEPGGFVLASEGKVFIAGANLREIMSLSDEELHGYLRFGSTVYGRIAAMPCTTVAAISGAALGGGLEIAMHCDRLIGLAPASSDPDKPVRPYQIGLPEAGLNICPGWGGTNLLPARMDGREGGAAGAMEMTATGQTMSVHEAVDAGLIEELVEGREALLARARSIAARPKSERGPRLVSISHPAHAEAARRALEEVRPTIGATQSGKAVIGCIEAGLDEGWDAALECERESLVRLRNTEQGRAAIEAFFAKSGASR